MTTTDIEDAYTARTAGSRSWLARAARVLPGGNTRSAGHHEPYPITVERADGPWLWDVDGNDYLDLSNNFTSLVHGHAAPFISRAVQEQIVRGSQWSHNAPATVELAELLCARIASVERVRFTNSGTEAAMLAVKLARRLTGRPLVLIATNGYHGFAPTSIPDGTGALVTDVLVADYNDLSSFEAVLAERGDQIAAVLIEAVQSSGGMASASAEFLAGLADRVHRHGALFVLDEVVTLRLAVGGSQQLLGIEPDLTILGKIIGGGLPIGALGGRAEVMDALDPRRPGGLRHAGTYNGNSLSCVAGLASVRALGESQIADLDRLGGRLERGLCEAARRHGQVLSVRRVGSLLNVFLSAAPPARMTERADLERMARFHLACLTEGVAFAARGLMCTSTAMDDEVLDELLRRLDTALARLGADDPA